MKFVMSLLLAATFATPAFAAEKKSKTPEVTNRDQIKEVIDITQFVSAEEKAKMNSYRLTELKDPNEQAGRDSKSWSVKPFLGGMRGRVLTPVEKDIEARHGKNSTYMGQQVGIDDTIVSGGLKLKIKFGAKQ